MKKFLKEWFELWVVPIAIAAYIFYPKLLRNDVYTQAAWGEIYLQKLLYALVIIFVGNLLGWLIVKFNNSFSSSLTLWQKSVLELVLFSVLFLGFILATLSL